MKKDNCCQTEKSDCCSNTNRQEKWITGFHKTKYGDIPIITTELKNSDIIKGWKVRWGINRMNYRIQDGLYCIGNPDHDSNVFVTANYKLTFDKLRKELSGLNAWIIVLDTKGVNVWCAAGKGTFGTIELIRQIGEIKLGAIVNHRKLILPQLGATGIRAQEIKEKTGFQVLYGPVYAKDIKEFLTNNMKKTEKMRRVIFDLKERLAVVPMELVSSIKPALIILFILFLVKFYIEKRFSFNFLIEFIPYIGAIIAGTVIVPTLLPYIPFRSFALKGSVIGVIWVLIIGFILNINLIMFLIYFLILVPIVSFLAINYTGASTFTSISGVKAEVKIATPIYLISIVLGVSLKIINVIGMI